MKHSISKYYNKDSDYKWLKHSISHDPTYKISNQESQTKKPLIFELNINDSNRPKRRPTLLANEK